MHRPTSLHAAVIVAAVALSTALIGCQTAPNRTTKAVLYRTSPILIDSGQHEPIRLTLAAGDKLGTRVRDVYLARTEGAERPSAEPVVVAQTAP